MKNLWEIEQNDFETINSLKQIESLFTLGNGYLGVRGDLGNMGKSFQSGTYINGYYEKGPISYGEKAYGYAQNWQTMIGIPEGKLLEITINGKKLFHDGIFLENKRILDMKNACTKWIFQWKDNEDSVIKGSLTTTVPFNLEGTLLLHWELEFPNINNEVLIKSELIYNRISLSDTNDPRISDHFTGSSVILNKEYDNEGRPHLLLTAKGSNLLVNSVMNHQINGLETNSVINEVENGFVESWSGKVNKKIEIIKSVSYNYDKTNNKNKTTEKLNKETKKIIKNGYKSIIKEHINFVNDFWGRSDVIITGNDDIQISLRFNLFHLLQSTGRDGKRSIAAKGLSGPGYEGHYFWDAEAYILPFFIFTNPKIAKSMLLYRISIMDEAKKRAKVLGHDGILFPWRTINGEESSAYYPAGTAQYHINSDIALGLSKYLEISGDLSILDQGGSELLENTANFWCSLGSYIDGKGFCFNTVTGPDEYTALVDNNYFTNLMAKENLLASIKWLTNRVSEETLQLWEFRANQIYLPCNNLITPQDDTFLYKEKWDFKNTKKSEYPLLLHFHPLNIYRKQVLKQADVVLAQSIKRMNFPPGLIKRNFDYYEEITTRDSSLSACAQGINAFWLGYEDLSWEYFLETVHTDLKDLHKNVFYGLHTASMGGAYLMILNGFLGVDIYNDTIIFRPKLPLKINSIECNISTKGALLNIKLNKNEIVYETFLNDITIYHFSEKIELKVGQKITLSTNPKIKLIIDKLNGTDLLELENEINILITKENVLHEEVLIIAKNNNDLKKYNSLGYFSVLESNIINQNKTNRLNQLNHEHIKFFNNKYRFMGNRP